MRGVLGRLSRGVGSPVGSQDVMATWDEVRRENGYAPEGELVSLIGKRVRRRGKDSGRELRGIEWK